FLPKTYIPGDRQRMDVYRRLTRCTSLEMLAALEQDMRDAFGEPPHQAIILFALTELRLLAGLFGIESSIRKPPDVVLTVRDAAQSPAIRARARARRRAAAVTKARGETRSCLNRIDLATEAQRAQRNTFKHFLCVLCALLQALPHPPRRITR